jgi:hypothetical protein
MRLLDKYAIAYKYEDNSKSVIESFKYSLEFYLYEDEPYFNKIKKELKEFNLHYYEGTLFEESDLEKAEWFWITTGEFQYPLPDKDFGYLKSTFNLENYCHICGIGKKQNAPFRLREPKQKNSQFWGLHWEHDAIFVRPETKKLLEEENLRGISFIKPKLYKKDIEIDNLYQVIIETTLKAGLNPYNCKTITCKYMNEEQTDSEFPNSFIWKSRTENANYCGRIKYHFPQRGGLTFESSIFTNAPNFVKSNEWFGASAMQLPIVSKRIKLFVEKNNLRGLKFTPIFYKEINFNSLHKIL